MYLLMGIFLFSLTKKSIHMLFIVIILGAEVCSNYRGSNYVKHQWNNEI